MKIYSAFPFDGEVYDYFIDFSKREFTKWVALVPIDWKFDSTKPFHSLLIPTPDTVKFKYVLQKLITINKNILVSGDSGVGKSVII